MDVNKLPVLIYNPAEQARKILNDKVPTTKWMSAWDFPDAIKNEVEHLTELKKDQGLGIVLKIINAYPGISLWGILEEIDKTTTCGHGVYTADCVELACMAKLAVETSRKEKWPDGYNQLGLYITDLGKNLLLQNGML